MRHTWVFSRSASDTKVMTIAGKNEQSSNEMAKHILHNRADATEQIMLHTVRNERKQSDVEETHSKQWFSIDKMIRSTCIQHI